MTPTEWACGTCGHIHDDGRACQSVSLGHGQTCNCDQRSASQHPTHTPRRSIRISEALWVAAQAKAAERSETVTDVIARALERYVKAK